MRAKDCPSFQQGGFTMSRKRKTSDDSPSNEIPIATVAPPTAVAAEEPVILPIAEPPVILPIAETPSADVNADQGFADKVGQKEKTLVADPFGIAKDNLAGIRLFESRQDRQVAIKFGEGRPEDKPSQAVIDKLKENGYRWNPMHKIWTHPVRPESALGTRIDAEKLYQEVRQMIRAEKGIESGQGVPF
jgi:hypothetical protein